MTQLPPTSRCLLALGACDCHPAKAKIRIGWFTSGDINKPFTVCGELGQGHPDPDIGFAEGKYYLINQTSTDYTSRGPWVVSVEIRADVDTTGDGAIDTWTDRLGADP